MRTSWIYEAVRTHALPSGLETTYDHDAHGNVTSITKHATGASDQVTSFDYDTAGNLTERTDPLEHAWSYTYNTHGDRTTATIPLGHETSYAHDDDGFTTSTLSPRGHLAGADPADFTTTIERDEAGQPTTVTDPLGQRHPRSSTTPTATSRATPTQTGAPPKRPTTPTISPPQSSAATALRPTPPS